METLAVGAGVLTFDSSGRFILFGCPQIITNARNQDTNHGRKKSDQRSDALFSAVQVSKLVSQLLLLAGGAYLTQADGVSVQTREQHACYRLCGSDNDHSSSQRPDIHLLISIQSLQQRHLGAPFGLPRSGIGD